MIDKQISSPSTFKIRPGVPNGLPAFDDRSMSLTALDHVNSIVPDFRATLYRSHGRKNVSLCDSADANTIRVTFPDQAAMVAIMARPL